jgi:hypothetical protein
VIDGYTIYIKEITNLAQLDNNNKTKFHLRRSNMEVTDKSINTKNLKHFSFELNRDPISKKAGSNRLQITRQVEDVYIQDQTVSMSIQEAKALQSFLNKYLTNN